MGKRSITHAPQFRRCRHELRVMARAPVISRSHRNSPHRRGAFHPGSPKPARQSSPNDRRAVLVALSIPTPIFLPVPAAAAAAISWSSYGRVTAYRRNSLPSTPAYAAWTSTAMAPVSPSIPPRCFVRFTPTDHRRAGISSAAKRSVEKSSAWFDLFARRTDIGRRQRPCTGGCVGKLIRAAVFLPDPRLPVQI